MEHRCACGNPAPTATICPACAYRLDEAIAQVCEHHGLAWDLDIATARQARITRRPPRRGVLAEVDDRQLPGTLRPSQSPYDARASAAAKTLHQTLAAWAAVVARDTARQRGPVLPGPTCHARRATCRHGSCLTIRASRPVPPPPEDLARVAAWLRPRVGWLRYHPLGQRAHDEIIDAVRQARHAVDRPAEQLYAGPCDQCGEDLYGRPGASRVECTACHLGYEVEARRDWLLRSAEDVEATANEIARAITSLGQPVTPSTIRSYVHRGRLVARDRRITGGRTVILYRLGDVLDVLTFGSAQHAGPVCQHRCEHPSCRTIALYLKARRRTA